MSLLFQPDCGYPVFPVAIMVPQNLFMLALFGDFYYKTYVKEKKKKTRPDDKYDDNNNSPAIAADSNNNGKTMANGNGITCRNNANNHYSNGKANGVSIS